MTIDLQKEIERIDRARTVPPSPLWPMFLTVTAAGAVFFIAGMLCFYFALKGA